jgi:hypothetical protein
MGGILSAPESKNPAAVLNFILREMFQRADMVDIYSLADKTRCSRYILTGADALESLFVKIRIQPARDKDGILYFQSLDGLMKGMPQDLKDKRRQYCLELSFFFIRIFQIFGALSLSMFDSSLPLADPTDEVLTKDQQKKQGLFLKPGEFYGFSQAAARGGIFSFFGFGGALNPSSSGNFYITDGSYKILNFHLMRPDTGSQTDAPMKMEGYPIFLDQKGLYDLTIQNGVVTARQVKSAPAPTLQYMYTRNSNNYQLTATLQIQGLDDYTVSLSNYTKDGTAAANVKTPSERLSSFGGGAPTSSGQGFPATKGKTLPTVLQAMFDSAATQILGAIPFSVVKFLRTMRYLSSSQNSDGSISGTHVNVPGSQDNSDSPRIIFVDLAQVGEEKQKRRVRITANLQIDEPRQDVLKGTYNYKVTVDFSNSQAEPPELRDNMKSYRTALFVAYGKDSAPKSDKTDMTIPQYLESVFQDIVKGGLDTNNSNSGSGSGSGSRSAYPKPYDSEEIPADLKIKNLWKALTKDPPVKSHCVARAVQLLSVDAIRGNMSAQAFSSACRLNFGYQKDGSLPAPKKPITDSYALHTLATLFWTDLHTQMPKIQDDKKYKKFLQFLQAAMGGDGAPQKMSEISEKLPAICNGRPDSRLEVPKGLASQLRSVANNLLNQQRHHVSEGMRILGYLFDMDSIVSRKQFGLNPAILSGGMPEVNRVAGLARDLLMNYYKGCETTYREGVGLIYAADQSAPLGARGADGARLPPRTITVRPTATNGTV